METETTTFLIARCSEHFQSHSQLDFIRNVVIRLPHVMMFHFPLHFTPNSPTSSTINCCNHGHQPYEKISICKATGRTLRSYRQCIATLKRFHTLLSFFWRKAPLCAIGVSWDCFFLRCLHKILFPSHNFRVINFISHLEQRKFENLFSGCSGMLDLSARRSGLLGSK